VLVLSGCGILASRREEPAPAPAPRAEAPAPPRGGAYYKDDGPGERSPAELAAIPDAVPRAEPLHRFANRPYEVFGRHYVPMSAQAPFRQRGTASWYGRRFHGQRTSSGEPYDMYAMTAAHPTLPIPSYARVTHLGNGRSVVVRVNDRGPFHAGRVIDLSYAAAAKLGYVEAGSAAVEVESVLPGETVIAAAPAAPASAPPAAPAAEPRGVFLQFGAFAARDNAESLRARLARELAGLGEALEVLASGALWKLMLGPYASESAARAAAARIETELNLRPLVVVR
jgi:rare lipoprotein A